MKFSASHLATSTRTYEGITLSVENGVITQIESGQVAGAKQLSGVVIPGFVDIHCHGGGGNDLSTDHKAAEFHLRHGSTTLLASFISEPVDLIKEKISRLKLERNLIGIHLEGPYLSHIHCGAHKKEYLLPPQMDDVKEYVSSGKVRYITIAPEIDGAIEAISYLSRNNVKVAIGHSAAASEDIKEALANGAISVTHFYNGMRKDLDAKNCLAGFSLNQSSLLLELVMDGVHVPFEILKEVVKRAPNRIIAITDAAPFAGNSDGDYQLGELPVKVSDGVARLSSNGALAGSMLTMDQAFKNAMIHLELDLVTAVNFFSTNPAKLLGEDHVGDIAVGKKANFLTLDKHWNLNEVYFEGELVS
jgi:N-acetylglucosamine-6-phosphate deacetylase